MVDDPAMDARYQAWLTKDPDPETRAALEAWVKDNNQPELQNAFMGRLAFGTAGLRGILGAGPNRMNRLVVRETSAGLGHYLLKTQSNAKERGVVVGFDARRGSRVFAEDTAGSLAALGIKVHLFDSEVATPVVAFAVRELAAAAGVVITASHNPPEYNGYKVYWDNGAQILAPHDAGIAQAIEQAATQEVKCDAKSSLIHHVGTALLEAYLKRVASVSIYSVSQDPLTIAYTPLHGVGALLAEKALAERGFEQVFTVASQRTPDGTFPTVSFPNPEEPGAMDAVIALAKEHDATLACANDPDADRFATAVKTSPGTYRMLTGDQVGALLGDALLRRHGPRSVVVSTLVSSRLLPAIAQAHGARFVETLTGFKWIADAGLKAQNERERFIFGYEEALGYCFGDAIRDKDGIAALMLFAELTRRLHQEGRTVWNALEELYRTHGIHVTGQRTLSVANSDATSIGEKLRQAPPRKIGGQPVLWREDLLNNANGPKSDVLIYLLENNTRVIVRPSGTEPKIKCYYEGITQVDDDEAFPSAYAKAHASLEALMQAHQSDIGD